MRIEKKTLNDALRVLGNVVCQVPSAVNPPVFTGGCNLLGKEIYLIWQSDLFFRLPNRSGCL